MSSSSPSKPPVEPIAVVGVGCRFPGGVRDLDSLGRVLAAGADLVRPVPADRWPAGTPGTHGDPAGVGAFLDDIDRFDADYFGIPPHEAVLLDPQHRLLFEVAWEAMSDAGRPRAAWRGSRTAVYMGLLAGDYQLLHARSLGAGEIGPHHISGMESSFAAGRLAYMFDLRGPAFAVHAACSSSLLAVHQAIRSLRSGEADLALAGGTSLVLAPDVTCFLGRAGALSPSGRCRPFSAEADGLVRGDGCGVVVLRRLSDALADGDRVHAVIRGSAAVHDGHSMGLTAPNAAAQAEMLTCALRDAGLHAHDVDYVEAHGTGTALGDQVELGVLAEIYGAGRAADRPLTVGAIKAVLGHADAAAGIAGLIKTISVLRSGRVPAQPNLDAERLNPAVDWPGSGLAVPTGDDGLLLTRLDRPLRAGVSAFGLSGTDVHVILEAPPAVVEPGGLQAQQDPYVLLVSAPSEQALTERVAAFRTSVETTPRLAALVASAATRSTFESYRYAAVADDEAALAAALLGDGREPAEDAYVGVVEDPEDPAQPVFVYSGQGGQWSGMAMDLYDSDPGVRDTLDECDELIGVEAGWSLINVLRSGRDLAARAADPAPFEQTDLVQPALFAVQVALTRWLAERGVRPTAVIGASLGEIAAAHVAGTLTLAQAVRIIVRRSRLLHETAGTAAMYAVQGEPEALSALMADLPAGLNVAAINGPRDLVLAGAADAVAEAARMLEARGLRTRKLRTDIASHTPLIDDLARRLTESLHDVAPAAPPRIRQLSTVDPDVDLRVPGAAYWGRNMNLPVRLWPAVDRLLARGDHPLIELGPHPVLRGPLTDALQRRNRRAPVIGTLRRDQPGRIALHRTLAQLYCAGVEVDWPRVTGRPERYHALPAPTWHGERYWLPGVERGAAVAAPVAAPVPPPAPAVAVPGPAPAPALAADLTVADRVEAAVRDVLGLSLDRRLMRRRGLFEQGIDSLTAARLRARLETDFGVELAATVVFEKPSIAALAAHLEGLVDQPTASAPTPAPTMTGREPIAVVGLACRLPGAESPDEFWSLLSEGRGTAVDTPPGRRNDPAWAEAGSRIPARSSYLDDVTGFDAGFFRISPREARSIDPQQRLMLEVSWDALEDAGLRPRTLAGKPVGVYVGLEAADYQQLMTRDMANVDLYYGTGTSFAAVAGRLSYFLGLTGPSLVVDTACSASLTAVHLACQGLRAGDCDVAVVGGANVLLAPTLLLAMADSGALAGDGMCRTFDENADGYGVGEGAVSLVLKPLSAAERDGDRVYAVLQGSAVNQDGASGGFTVPNASAQTDLIRRALKNAGWTAPDVAYVEAHGTGTPLGDPIEVAALAEAYGAGRAADRPLLIGSVKPNVGHLAAAAGVTGLLKVILSMGRRVLPRHLIERPSSRIAWDRLPVEVVTEPRAWPDLVPHGSPARAGVSSFGLTGTNAHVLVEAPPPTATVATDHVGEYVLPLSAASPAALREAAARLATVLRESADRLDDIVYTCTYRRSWLEHRLVVIGDGADELAESLAAVAAGQAPPNVHFGQADPDDVDDIDAADDDLSIDRLLTGPEPATTPTPARRPVSLPGYPWQHRDYWFRDDDSAPSTNDGIVFVYPGQGGQWPGMGADLLDRQPVFAQAMAACDAALHPYTGWHLLDVIRRTPTAPSLERVDVVQPALWAMMVALTRLWQSVGVTPAAVVGHSQGEIAAAHIAGALSLDDAARIVALRSKAITALAGTGGMASIATTPEHARELAAAYPGIELAAVNSPSSVVVCGPPETLNALLAHVSTLEIRNRLLPVDYASHSSQVERLREELLTALAPITPQPTKIPFYSALTGALLDPTTLTAEYWYENLRNPVRFATATDALLTDGLRSFLEPTPHPTLMFAVEQTAERAGLDITTATTLTRNTPEPPTVLSEAQDNQHAGLADWRYRVTWHPADLDPNPAPISGGDNTWIIVDSPSGNASGWAEAAATALAKHGADIHEWVIADDASVDDVAEQLSRLPEPVGVLSLLDLDPTTTLARALMLVRPRTRLWALTSGAVAISADEPVTAPAQARIHGLMRVIGLDSPQLWGGQIDVPRSPDPVTSDLLRAALTNNQHEDQLAIRADGVFARRLDRAPRPESSQPWRASGTVLVTGGTGGIGGHLAHWLAGNGAEHLLLLNRTGPDTDRARRLEAELAAAHPRTTVTIAACDLTDAAELERVLAEHEVSAVFHTAGVMGRRAPLDELGPADFADVFDAKVHGARNLDRLLGARPLDAFVLFSSNAGVWGSAGQAPYAAANAYLDALAAERRGRGLAGTSVAWGHWAGLGGSADTDAAEFLERRGLRPMPAHLGVRALADVLAHDETCVSIADVDWNRFAATYAGARPRPLIANLTTDQDTANTAAAELATRPALAEQVAALPAARRDWALIEAVRAEAAHVLGHGGTADLGADQQFKALGVDSLTAVELRNRLAAATGLRLPAALIFDYPTPRAVAGYLRARLEESRPATPPALGAIDAMSVDELLELAGKDGA
ncbi:MAG TPA: type I polyketide synthase [Actinospica sp.]|nr:type I polyketide synthase [Actinospica sp.]